MKKFISSFLILSLPFFSGFLAASVVDDATIHSEKIVLGSGCFWGAEKGYESLPGVIDEFLATLMARALKLHIERLLSLKISLTTIIMLRLLRLLITRT